MYISVFEAVDENVIVSVMNYNSFQLTVANHNVPVGNSDSINVTSYSINYVVVGVAITPIDPDLE
jgi:hypothetical protein